MKIDQYFIPFQAGISPSIIQKTMELELKDALKVVNENHQITFSGNIEISS